MVNIRVNIREFISSDLMQLESCFAELQSFERTIELNRADAQSIAKDYVKQLMDECRRWDGRIFVAEQDGRIVGFVCVLSRFDSGEITEANRVCAYVTDLMVTSSMRRRGIGRQLLQEAEAFAAHQGATVIRMSVLARNAVARSLYMKAGFR